MDEQAAHTPPGPAPLPPPAPFRFLRARDGVLGGVCAGIANAANVDVTLVRLAFVAAGLAGFGVILYLILWVVVPREDPAAGRVLLAAPPDTARWMRIALVVGAVLGLMGLVGGPFGWSWGGPDEGATGFWLGMILIALGGAYLWSRRRRRPLPPPGGPMSPVAPGSTMPGTSTPWGPPQPGSAPATAGVRPIAASGQATTLTSATGPTTALPSAGGPSGGLIAARVIGWLAVIATVLVTLPTVVLAATGVLSVEWPVVAGVATLVAFTALVATTAGAGRPWPIVASLALLAGAGIFVAATSHWNGGIGQRIVTPQSVTELAPSYELAVGRRVVDLSDLDLPEGRVPVTVDQGVGQVEVVVPADARVTADVHVGAGEARVLGRVDDGFDVDLTVTDGSELSTGQLSLDVDLGIGQVRVCRASALTGGDRGCGPTG